MSNMQRGARFSKMVNVKLFGTEAENYFAAQMHKCGVDITHKDSVYDFLVNEIEVEVKSTLLYHRNGCSGTSIGHFDFTGEDQRIHIHENKTWVCLIIRHDNQFLILGFIRGDNLWRGSISSKRYFSIKELKDSMHLISFDEWIRKVLLKVI